MRWIEERREHFLSATHSRDQLHDVEIGFDDEGRILAIRDDYIVDCGAWNPIGSGVAYNTAVHLTGPYKIEHLAASGRIVATNKVPNAPYRGAGRPEACFAMERSIDLVARTLGLEPAEVRRRNMIRADEMPYRAGLLYRDGEPIVYDSGDYPGALEKALDAIGGVAAFRTRQAEARRDGRYLGLGIGCYIEGTGVGPFEGAVVRIDPDGKIYASSGACPQGQGMETIFAQIVADLWKVAPDDVVVSLADTAAIPIGFGTMASRSTVTVSAAIHHASLRLRDKDFAIAANLLECAPADLELRDGGVGVVGVPGADGQPRPAGAGRAPGLGPRPAARGSMPGWRRPITGSRRPSPGAMRCTSAIVEVDPDTGSVDIAQYVVAHDCGVVVNPMLVEGQIMGGTAQGLGGILCEAIAYDGAGQLLTGTLMDYALPSATDIPAMTDHASAFAVAAQPARRQGRRRRRRGGAASGDRQCGVRCPRAPRVRDERNLDQGRDDPDRFYD